MGKTSAKSRNARRARAVKRIAIGLGAGALATTAQAAPLVETAYETLSFGSDDTFLTGIRGSTIVGNYVIPGTIYTGGLLYDMMTETWFPLPVATANGANYPGAIGSSPYGPSFGGLGGVLRTVGSYQTESSAPYDLSYLYDAALAPGQTLTPLAFPDGASPTLFTIAHSTFGHQVVGDYDTQLATGNAFVYDIDTGDYTTNNHPDAVSTTAYGIYGDKIAGGYATASDKLLGFEKGYIYDQTTGVFTTYEHPGAVITHFEGITGAGRAGSYNLVTNWAGPDGKVNPAVMHVNALGHVTWHPINIPGDVVSANSAYGDKVIGIYVSGGVTYGYVATMPGIYDPIRNTGTLSFADDNDAALSGIMGDDIVNSGTIAATGTLGIGMRGETWGVLTNEGTVTASGLAGAAVEMHGRYGTLLNYGTLRTTVLADAVRTGLDAHGTVMQNRGVIDGRLAMLGGTEKRFENSGWLGVSGTGPRITHLLSGTFVQTETGTYAMRLTDTGHDRMAIIGTARLAGALSATFQTLNFAPATTLIAATDGITGAFDSLVTAGLPALFDATLSYGADSVTLNVAADITSLPVLSPNEGAIGDALDQIINTPTDGMLSDLPVALLPLYDLSADELPGALDALSGEGYASAQSVLIGDSVYSRQAVLGRLRQGSYAGRSDALAALSQGGPVVSVSTSGAPASRLSASEATFWGQAYGGRTELDGDGGLSDVTGNYGGVIAGMDAPVDSWIVGAALGYSQSDTSAEDLSSSFDVDSILLAVYAGTSAGPWNVRLGASHAFNQNSSARTISYPGYSEQASADYDGGTTQVFAEAGYGIAVGKTALEPFANLAWINVDTDAFTETGASAGLSGASMSSSVGYGTIGLRAAASVEMADGSILQPRGSIAWQNAFGDLSPEAQMAFVSAPGAAFAVGGVPVARNMALIEIGADLIVSPNAKVGLAYIGQFADGVSNNGLQANVTWRF